MRSPAGDRFDEWRLLETVEVAGRNRAGPGHRARRHGLRVPGAIPAGRRHHGRGNPAAARRVTIVLDGGLATELEARGHDLSDRLWSARLLLSEPNAIEEVHLAYFRAGARVAITASYQASVEGFAAAGLDRPTAIEAIRRSVERATRAYTVPGRGGGSRPRSGPHARRWIGRPVRRDARGRLGIPRRL